jgi:hypothetical protein
MIQKFIPCHRVAILAALVFGLMQLPNVVMAQESYEKLYNAAAIQKHKVRSFTVEFFAATEGVDSVTPQSRTPDYRERYFFDDQGRPSRYEAVNPNIRMQGSLGPQLMSRYEYSDDGRSCHRHDTTVFGASGEWHFKWDSLGRRAGDVMFLADSLKPSAFRTYFYDSRGRLEKQKTLHQRSGGTKKDQCAWVFYVHDLQSFNATNLSPMEMERCQCNLEYLDDQGRAARRIAYDSSGTVSQSILMTYDRTGKPIKLEMRDKSGVTTEASADIVYERNGLVKVLVTGPGSIFQPYLSKLATMGRTFVADNWASWRLLREIRILQGKQEYARYIFTYDIRS